MTMSNPAISPTGALVLQNRSTQSLTHSALLVLMGSIAIAVASQLAVRLPWTPVPVTGQTLAILLVGASLGSARGTAAVALYLFEGLIGLPVFAFGSFGPAALLGPTGGYLVGFLLAAFVAGQFADHGMDRRWKTALPGFILAQIGIYALGTAWLALFVGGDQALRAGVLPFIPGDVIKVILASAALPSAWRLTQQPH